MGKEIILGKYLVNMPNHKKFEDARKNETKK